MSRDNGAGNVAVAFVLGAVAGAAVALLYAPASGRETREFIGEKARDGRERATEAAAKGREAIDRGRETVTTAIERGRETVTNAIERGREAYQQARAGSPASSSRDGA
jgi:gas vesicle protein